MNDSTTRPVRDRAILDRSAKGAMSAVATLVLLAGGAGTLAYWSDSEAVGGTPLSAGRLDIVTDATNTGCAGWRLDDAGGSPTALTAATRLVPGDTLTRTCAYTVRASGDHLTAAVSVTTPGFSGTDGDLGGMLTASVGALTVDGTPVAGLTSAQDGKRLAVTVTVTWNGADTGHMDARSTLDDLTLVAEQTHA